MPCILHSADIGSRRLALVYKVEAYDNAVGSLLYTSESGRFHLDIPKLPCPYQSSTFDRLARDHSIRRRDFGLVLHSAHQSVELLWVT